MNTLHPGPHQALNAALLAATLPGGGILPHLLDGRPKAIVAFWCGDPMGFGGDFDAERGDGRTMLVRPGEQLYADPWFVGPGNNIRVAVPFWLLHNQPGTEPSQGAVLAAGAIHPIYNSATLEFYDPISSEEIERVYLVDPRVCIDRRGRLLSADQLPEERRATQPRPSDWVNPQEQQRRLREMGMAPLHLPPSAPVLYRR